MSMIALYALSKSPGPQDAFRHLVPRWWASVAAMNPLPDQIVVACHDPDYSGVACVPQPLQSRTSIVMADVQHLNQLYDVAIRECRTTWVAWSGLDDVMLPDAFADVPAADAVGASVIVGSIQLLSGGFWRGQWKPNEIGRWNTLPACSPHTKKLWSDVGGYPGDIYFADWAFWMKAAKHGAVPFQATRPQMLFDDGVSRVTLSGRLASEDVKTRARDQAVAYYRSLHA